MPVPKGALQWIRETMSPEFFEKAKQAIGMAKATGNEHAVTQGYLGKVLPIASGTSHRVMPNYPMDRNLKNIPRTDRIEALLHTHPYDADFGITVAPSSDDLTLLPHINDIGGAVRQLIVHPEKDTFVDYSMRRPFDLKTADKAFFDLMKYTGADVGGREPIKSDVYFSVLRRMAENPQNGVKITHELGDETDYANEIFKILKSRGMRTGGLVSMKGRKNG